MISIGDLKFELCRVVKADSEDDGNKTVVAEVKPAESQGSIIAVVSDSFAVQESAKALLNHLGERSVTGDLQGILRRFEANGSKLTIGVTDWQDEPLIGDDAAAACGVSKATLYRALVAGKLTKVNGKFSRRQCEQFRRNREARKK